MGRVISTCIQFIDAFSNPSKETIKSMKNMAKEAKAAGKSIEGTGKTISNAGSALTKSITMPVVGIATAAVKTATDFESAMTEVKVIAGATAGEFDKLKQEAKNLGATTKFSAIESAEAMQYMAQAGWDTQSILEGTEGVMNAAAASGESLASVASIVSKNITAFGDSAKQSTMYADVMSAAAAVSAADINYLGEGFKYCASTAGSMGYSVQDMSIALAAMSQAGIEAGTAGATLRNIISNMAKPSKQQAAVMDQLGLSLTDSSGKTKDFATIMNDLRTSFSGLSESEKAAAASGLAGKESMAGLLSIVNTSDKDFKTFTDAINNSTGTAKDMAAEMQNNLSGQITLLKSGLEGVAITIGDKLLPYIKNAVTWLQKATSWLNSLSDAQVSQVMKWAGIAAAIGPCILIFGKVVTGVGKVVTIFGSISAAVAKAGGVMALLTSPAGIVVGVLAAIAVAAVLVVKNWDKIKPVIMNVKQWFVDTFGNEIRAAITGFKIIFEKVVNGIKAMLPSVVQFLKNAIQAAIPVIQTIINTISKVLPKAIEFVKTVITSITPIIKTVIGVVMQVAPIIAKTVVSIAQKVAPVIKSIAAVIRAVIPIIGKMFVGAFEIVGNIIKKVMPPITKIAKVIGSTLVFAVKTVAPVVTKLAGTFATVFSKIFTTVAAVVNKLRPVFAVIGTVIKTVMGVVGNVIEFRLKGIVSVLTSVAGSIKQVISGIAKVFSGLSDFISGVFTGNWSKAWEGVKNIFGGVFEALAGLCKVPINAVIGLINNAINGINSISVDIPEGIPLVGGKHIGFNIPTIPALAIGTPDWKGGLAQINEKGGEIVDLPKGSRVYPHDESVSMARKSADNQLAAANRKLATLDKGGKSKGDITINIPKLADQIIVKDKQDIDEITEQLATKLKNTALNMGVC